MNDLLKNLQDLAEKQGISMEKFRIRPANDQGPSSSKNPPNSTENMSRNSSRADLPDAHQINDWKNIGSTRTDDSILQKLENLKRLHRQMADAIADIENDIYAMDHPLQSIDKGKQKM